VGIFLIVIDLLKGSNGGSLELDFFNAI